MTRGPSDPAGRRHVDAPLPRPDDPDDVRGGGLTVAPTQPHRGLVLVRVLGEVDMLTAAHLGAVLDGAIRTVAADRDTGQVDAPAADPPSVVCDLSAVTFLGASGLDVFVTAQRTAGSRGVRLVLVAAHRAVTRPLQLTALDRRVTVTATHPALGRAVVVSGELER